MGALSFGSCESFPHTLLLLISLRRYLNAEPIIRDSLVGCSTHGIMICRRPQASTVDATWSLIPSLEVSFVTANAFLFDAGR